MGHGALRATDRRGPRADAGRLRRGGRRHRRGGADPAPLRRSAARSGRAPDPPAGGLWEEDRRQPPQRGPGIRARGQALAHPGDGARGLPALAAVAPAAGRRGADRGLHPGLSADGAAQRGRGRLGPAVPRRAQGRSLAASGAVGLLVGECRGAPAAAPPTGRGLRDPSAAQSGPGRPDGAQALGRSPHRHPPGGRARSRRGLRLPQRVGLGAGGCRLQDRRAGLVDAAGPAAGAHSAALLLHQQGDNGRAKRQRAQPGEPGGLPLRSSPSGTRW